MPNHVDERSGCVAAQHICNSKRLRAPDYLLEEASTWPERCLGNTARTEPQKRLRLALISLITLPGPPKNHWTIFPIGISFAAQLLYIDSFILTGTKPKKKLLMHHRFPHNDLQCKRYRKRNWRSSNGPRKRLSKMNSEHCVRSSSCKDQDELRTMCSEFILERPPNSHFLISEHCVPTQVHGTG